MASNKFSSRFLRLCKRDGWESKLNPKFIFSQSFLQWQKSLDQRAPHTLGPPFIYYLLLYLRGLSLLIFGWIHFLLLSHFISFFFSSTFGLIAYSKILSICNPTHLFEQPRRFTFSIRSFLFPPLYISVKSNQ